MRSIALLALLNGKAKKVVSLSVDKAGAGRVKVANASGSAVAGMLSDSTRGARSCWTRCGTRPNRTCGSAPILVVPASAIRPRRPDSDASIVNKAACRDYKGRNGSTHCHANQGLSS